jgi:hypothetical protein
MISSATHDIVTETAVRSLMILRGRSPKLAAAMVVAKEPKFSGLMLSFEADTLWKATFNG